MSIWLRKIGASITDTGNALEFDEVVVLSCIFSAESGKTVGVSQEKPQKN